MLGKGGTYNQTKKELNRSGTSGHQQLNGTDTMDKTSPISYLPN